MWRAIVHCEFVFATPLSDRRPSENVPCAIAMNGSDEKSNLNSEREKMGSKIRDHRQSVDISGHRPSEPELSLLLMWWSRWSGCRKLAVGSRAADAANDGAGFFLLYLPQTSFNEELMPSPSPSLPSILCGYLSRPRLSLTLLPKSAAVDFSPQLLG